MSSMMALLKSLCLSLIALVAICLQDQTTTGAEVGSALSNVILNCTNKLNFKAISEFEKFHIDFKLIVDGQSQRSKSNEHLEKCLSDKEAIFALHKLVTNYDKKRPCKLTNVNKLEEFARNYLLSNRKSMTLKFFTLFSVNIAIKCKINLMAHLKQADMEADQLDFIYSMASPTGWNVLINEHTKKSMKFGSSSYAGSNLINRVAKLIPGLAQVDQFEFMNFNHPHNLKKVDTETGVYKMENPAISENLMNSLSQIIRSCKNLDKFYVNSILSITKLVDLGINIDLLNDQHESSHLLHKWLAAASFCQLMVRVELSLAESKDAINFKIIHNDNMLEDRRKLYSYVAEVDEISPLATSIVWQVSVSEGKWCQKSKAMFKQGSEDSAAKLQLQQFIKGLDRDFAKAEANSR